MYRIRDPLARETPGGLCVLVGCKCRWIDRPNLDPVVLPFVIGGGDETRFVGRKKGDVGNLQLFAVQCVDERDTLGG